MSQYDLPTIDPTIHDGTDLANYLNNWESAVLSQHAGGSRPGYATPGMLWVNNGVADQLSLNLFDGSHDVLLFTIDTTTGDIIAGGGAGGGAMTYQGSLDPTTAAPVSNAGDTYVSNAAGTIDASFSGISGETASVGDTLIYDGSDWVLINNSIDLSGYLPLNGGTLTDFLTLHADPLEALQAATKQYVDNSLSALGGTYLALTGGTISGTLTLNADPANPLEAATKQYVDTAIAAVDHSAYLELAGGTMTGSLTLNADPANPLEAATKQYVDSAVSGFVGTAITDGTSSVAIESANGPIVGMVAGAETFRDDGTTFNIEKSLEIGGADIAALNTSGAIMGGALVQKISGHGFNWVMTVDGFDNGFNIVGDPPFNGPAVALEGSDGANGGRASLGLSGNNQAAYLIAGYVGADNVATATVHIVGAKQSATGTLADLAYDENLLLIGGLASHGSVYVSNQGTIKQDIADDTLGGLNFISKATMDGFASGITTDPLDPSVTTDRVLSIGTTAANGGAYFIGHGTVVPGFSMWGSADATIAPPIAFTARHNNAGTLQAVPDGNQAFRFGNYSDDILKIMGNGALATGFADGSNVSGGGIEINTGNDDGAAIALANEDVSHPFTTYKAPGVYGVSTKKGATEGGLLHIGYASASFAAFEVQAYSQTPQTSSTSNGAINFRGWKSDGATGRSPLGNDDNLFSIDNGGSIVELTKGSGTKIISGGLATGGSDGSNIATGGLEALVSSGSGWSFILRKTGISNPFSSVAPSNAFLAVSNRNGTNGGSSIRGFAGGGTAAINLYGYQETGETALSTNPAIWLTALKSDGSTGTSSFADNEVLVGIANVTSTKIGFFGNGDIKTNGSVATGGATGTNVDTGGIEIKTLSNLGLALVTTCNVTHAFTADYAANQSFELGKNSGSLGGARITGIAKSVGAGLNLRGLRETGDSSTATIRFDAAVSDGGTGRTGHTGSHYAFSFDDNGNERVWITGAGQIITQDGISFDGGANVLRDYKKGIWSVEVADAATGGNVGTATVNLASYSRIGDDCFISLDLSAINTVGLEQTNVLFFRNLPFVAAAAGLGSGVPRLDSVTYTETPYVTMLSGGSAFFLRENSSGGAGSNTLVSAFSSGSARIRVNFSYSVA